MRDPQNAIEVSNVTKHFILPHQKANSLKSFFMNPFSRYKNEKQRAFHNLSFDIKKGEFFGIVGRNGSGKSTLLKCMAGVYTTDTGSITVDGTLVPFIELGVGFNPELSGRDNVFLNGALLGFSRKEMTEMYDEIVEFSELEKFMDQKLKNYSSGMQVRLAFSIAIRAHGDILLLDEVLAVGDSAFQQKCFDYFDTMKSKKKTIVLVSHSMGIIERYCDRALFLEKGIIRHIGSSNEIARLYEEMFLDEEITKRAELRSKNSTNNQDVYKDDIVTMSKVRTVQNGRTTTNIKALQDFEIQVDFTSSEDVSKAIARMNIKNRRGFVVIASDSDTIEGGVSLKKGVKQTLTFKINNHLTNDIYGINVSFSDISTSTEIGLTQKRPVSEFSVKGIEKYPDSITHPPVTASIS